MLHCARGATSEWVFSILESTQWLHYLLWKCMWKQWICRVSICMFCMWYPWEESAWITEIKMYHFFLWKIARARVVVCGGGGIFSLSFELDLPINLLQFLELHKVAIDLALFERIIVSEEVTKVVSPNSSPSFSPWLHLT